MSIITHTKLRFKIHEDILLLREILRWNPFEDYQQWKNIQKTIVEETGKDFSVRTVREHTEHLIKLFKKGDRSNLRKSGTEQQYHEKEQLLQQILDLKNEVDIYKNIEKKRGQDKDITMSPHFLQPYILRDNENSCKEASLDEKQPSKKCFSVLELENNKTEVLSDENEGPKTIADNICKTTNEDIGDTLHSTLRLRRKRILQNNQLQYLKKRKEKEMKLRERELDLEERKIEIEERRIRLDEAKFEIEKLEREERLKIEIEERTRRMRIENQQIEIHSILVKHLILDKK